MDFLTKEKDGCLRMRLGGHGQRWLFRQIGEGVPRNCTDAPGAQPICLDLLPLIVHGAEIVGSGTVSADASLFAEKADQVFGAAFGAEDRELEVVVRREYQRLLFEPRRRINVRVEHHSRSSSTYGPILVLHHTSSIISRRLSLAQLTCS
jgi:hypothetical protein